jgi:hypothetical protein
MARPIEAIVNRTHITPSGFASDSYALIASAGARAKPALDIMTNVAPMISLFFGTAKI